MDHIEFGKRWALLHILRRRYVQKQTADCELYPGQLHLLETAIREPGRTQQELAARLGVTPASVAQSAKRLSAAGFLERRVDEKNHRRNMLYATELGKRAAKRYRDCFDEVDRVMLGGFSDAELAILCGYLDRIIENTMDDAFDPAEHPYLKGFPNA